MRTVKVLMDDKAPQRPPIKVLVDGEEWRDVYAIGWDTKYGGVSSVTFTIDARFEVEYVNRPTSG